jgi:hypothetical protein
MAATRCCSTQDNSRCNGHLSSRVCSAVWEHLSFSVPDPYRINGVPHNERAWDRKARCKAKAPKYSRRPESIARRKQKLSSHHLKSRALDNAIVYATCKIDEVRSSIDWHQKNSGGRLNGVTAMRLHMHAYSTCNQNMSSCKRGTPDCWVQPSGTSEFVRSC